LFITPDNLYNSPNSDECITFAYGPTVGLVYDNGSSAHYDMLSLRAKEAFEYEEPDEIVEELEAMVNILWKGEYSDFLFGRLGQATQYLVDRYTDNIKRAIKPYLDRLQQIVDEEGQIIII